MNSSAFKEYWGQAWADYIVTIATCSSTSDVSALLVCTALHTQTTCRRCSKFSVAPMSIWTSQNSSTVSSSVVLAVCSGLLPASSWHVSASSTILISASSSILLSTSSSWLLPASSLHLSTSSSWLLSAPCSILLSTSSSWLLCSLLHISLYFFLLTFLCYLLTFLSFLHTSFHFFFLPYQYLFSWLLSAPCSWLLPVFFGLLTSCSLVSDTCSAWILVILRWNLLCTFTPWLLFVEHKTDGT